MDIHFLKDGWIVGLTGNNRRMVRRIDRLMAGWILKNRLMDEGKQMDDWMERKNRMMVEWIKIDGWLDEQKKRI